MVIKTYAKVTCDNCKEVEAETTQKIIDTFGGSYPVTSVPKGWYFLEKIHIRGTKIGKKPNELNICEDPQFCCKECLMEYLEKQLKKIK